MCGTVICRRPADFFTPEDQIVPDEHSGGPWSFENFFFTF